jgi:hypothetical protein
MFNKIMISRLLKIYAGYAFSLAFMLQSSWVLLLGVLALIGVAISKNTE